MNHSSRTFITTTLLLITGLVLSFQNCSGSTSHQASSSDSAKTNIDGDGGGYVPPSDPEPVESPVDQKLRFYSDVNFTSPTVEGEFQSAQYGVRWQRLVTTPESLASLPANTIYGTEGNDQRSGGSDANVMSAQGGDDEFYGNQGDDTIFGNQGNDRIFGGQNNDDIYGGQQNDQLYGNLGDDRLWGNKDNDELYGNDGNDTLNGNEGEDALYGNRGNDLLFGNEGNDILFGGQDHDLLFGGQNDDELYGNLGHDILSGDRGYDILSGGDGNDAYLFSSRSSGIEIVDETSGTDSLICLDVTLQTIERDGDDLLVHFDHAQVRIRGHFLNGQGVENFINCGHP